MRIFYAVIFCVSMLFPVFATASSTVGDVINDTLITGKVKSSFVINEITAGQNIGVETNNGVVKLSGTVDSHTQVTAAMQIAQETDGVKSVDASRLRVRESRQPFTDTYITVKVKMIFLLHGVSAAVETENGVVYLSGFVKSSEQSEKALHLAGTVSGVVGVRSDLAVKPL
jgi:hyperosmotically inducible protein